MNTRRARHISGADRRVIQDQAVEIAAMRHDLELLAKALGQTLIHVDRIDRTKPKLVVRG